MVGGGGGGGGSEAAKGEGRTKQPGPIRQWWVTETPIDTRDRVEKMLWSPTEGDSTPAKSRQQAVDGGEWRRRLEPGGSA